MEEYINNSQHRSLEQNESRIKRKYNRFIMNTHMDFTVLFVVLFLVVFGIIMVYSTSFNVQVDEGKMKPFEKQILFAVIGFVLMYFVSKVQITFINKFALLGYLITIVLMFVVLKSGESANGSRRWIELNGMKLQPSEIGKFTIIVVLAGFLTTFKKYLNKIQVVALWLIILIIPFVLIGIADFSTTVILMAVSGAMLFVAYQIGVKIILFGGIILGLSGLFITSFAYRQARINVWLEGPWEYADSYGRQVIQSLYAIGSGGFTGVGLGQSIQKLGYISEAQNDIIFAVICEELGLVGGVAIILLYLLLIYRIAQIAMTAKSMNHLLITIGVMTHISIQAFINIGVAVGLVPVTGVPLPFVSAGGSSLIMLLVEIGLVLNVSRHNTVEEMIGGQ